MTDVRQPIRDSLGESPVDWVDIPLGPGQAGNNDPHLQFTREGDALRGTDIRRRPDSQTHVVVHRPPESPA